MKRSNSAAGPQSLSRAASRAQLSRAASSAQLSTASSTGSLISLPSLTTPPGIKTWLAKPQTQEDTAAAGSGKPSAAAAAAEVAAPAAVTAVRSISGGCSGDEAASGSNTSSPKSTCGVVVSVTATALAADPKLIDTKPAAAAEAAAAAVQSGQQERGREGSYTAEVVGFVLLDPLWEGGVEVGYVTSMMRMKRSAHTGTAGHCWAGFWLGTHCQGLQLAGFCPRC